MHTLSCNIPFRALIHLTRLHRPIGIYLLLWPTLSALWFASNGVPAFSLLFIFTTGTILMRSAGCAINDYADRKIDKHVVRTQQRPLVTGVLSARMAVYTFCMLSFCAFLLVLYLPLKAIMLSFVTLFLAAFYPFTKRFCMVPQIFLGAAYAMGVPMAYAACAHSFDTTGGLLYIATILWSLAYDIFYAQHDKPEDIPANIRSMAIYLGTYTFKFTATMQGIILCIYAYLYYQNNFSFYTWGMFICAAICALYTQLLTVKGIPKLCLRAFLHSHYVGLFLWLGVVFSLT